MPQSCKILNCGSIAQKMCCGEFFCVNHFEKHVCFENKFNNVIAKVEKLESEVDLTNTIKVPFCNEVGTFKQDGAAKKIFTDNHLSSSEYLGQILLILFRYIPYLKVFIGFILTILYGAFFSNISFFGVMYYSFLKYSIEIKKVRFYKPYYFIFKLKYFRLIITGLCLPLLFLKIYNSCLFQHYLFILTNWYVLKYYDYYKNNLFGSISKKNDMSPNLQLLYNMFIKELIKRECYILIFLDTLNLIILPGIISKYIFSVPTINDPWGYTCHPSIIDISNIFKTHLIVWKTRF
tara:strand:- start:1165 stop:2040 length:876 start_codon:yes stop_codon:yes gene_type:complete